MKDKYYRLMLVPQHGFRRQLIGGLDHFIEQLFEFFQTSGRNDDSVATTTDFFTDAEEPPTNIFLEGQDKGFALNVNSLLFQHVLGDWRLGRKMRLMPVR